MFVPSLGLIAQGLPGVIFLVAGLSKASQLRWFAAQLREYRVLPPRTVMATAAVIAFAEVVAGALLLSRVAPFASVALAAGLLIVFSGGAAWSWTRGTKPSNCGCGVGLGGSVGPWLFVRNTALLSMLVASLWATTLSSTVIGLALVAFLSAVIIDGQPTSAALQGAPSN